jgi:hypothetical protein
MLFIPEILLNFHRQLLGRSPTEATRLQFDQEKQSLYSPGIFQLEAFLGGK